LECWYQLTGGFKAETLMPKSCRSKYDARGPKKKPPVFLRLEGQERTKRTRLVWWIDEYQLFFAGIPIRGTNYELNPFVGLPSETQPPSTECVWLSARNRGLAAAQRLRVNVGGTSAAALSPWEEVQSGSIFRAPVPRANRRRYCQRLYRACLISDLGRDPGIVLPDDKDAEDCYFFASALPVEEPLGLTPGTVPVP